MNTLERPARPAAVGIVQARPPVQLPASPGASASLVEFGTRRALVVAGVMLAVLLQTIDITIVNVALPTIQGNLGASIDEATWVMTGYVIANVVVIPITPWLQRRFGRKQYFLASIIGFTVVSVLCGLSTSLSMLIAFRVVQGMFGGGLLSTAQVIMRDTFPPEQLGTSQSILTLGAVVGPSIGPTLGGIITDNFSWPFVFMVNIVPGAIAVLLVSLYLRDNAVPRREPIDVTGIVLLSVAVAALQFVLDQGQLFDWFSDSRITGSAIVAALAAVAFVWHELRTPAPIVDLRVLRYPGVAVAGLASMVNAVGIFGAVLLLPQFTVGELGFTSTLAGMLIGTRAIPVLLLSLPVGRLSNRKDVDLRYLIGGGLVVSGLGNVWLALRVTTGGDYWSFAPPLILCGLGIAFVWSPLLVATLRAAPPAEGPKAASIIILAMQLGGSIASALMVALWDRRQQFHQSDLAAEVTLTRHAVATYVQTHPIAELYHQVVAQSSAMAYMDAFWLVGWLSVCFAPALYFLKQWQKA